MAKTKLIKGAELYLTDEYGVKEVGNGDRFCWGRLNQFGDVETVLSEVFNSSDAAARHMLFSLENDEQAVRGANAKYRQADKDRSAGLLDNGGRSKTMLG